MGFEVPLDSWLRGPLRSWAEDLLEPRALSSDGLLDSKLIRQTWWRHLHGQEDLQHTLWPVLMFQAWRRG